MSQKEAAKSAVDGLAGQLREIALLIHDNPELGLNEHKAVGWLTQPLRDAGFKVDVGIAGLKTAFRAEWSGAAGGPSIAFLAEYDALNGLGHACGHNLIGTAAVGAALALKASNPSLPGRILVFGTPSEEDLGGKVVMTEAGVFSGLDAALMVHPMRANMMGGRTLACVDATFKFYGVAAHASAAPERGISALDAMIMGFNAIATLRQFIRDGNRIHGIIKKGGDAPNIVPDFAEAAFIIRSPSVIELADLKQKVYNAVRLAAESMGARCEVIEGLTYAELVNNEALAGIFKQNMLDLGLEVVEPASRSSGGSSDIGNVSQVTATIHPYIKITSGPAANHTREFCEASKSDEAIAGMLMGAKVLAMTALDLINDEAALQSVRAEFERGRNAEAADEGYQG
jgi:amidohydrolase